ncbi:MAG: type I DNA topoisomerase [Clostridia bacterium]|nr:type I DNA topoisomerase [Clostridia bacterium]
MESPTKAKTVDSFLGKDYKVIGCTGHVRDLPKSTLSVDVNNGFKPKYINIHGKSDIIAQLRKEAKGVQSVILATDPDREGEAIAWHLATVLGLDPDAACRVTFNEITKTEVLTQIAKPRPIDMNLVNSQQARRVLDRIVGYKLSPFLWKTVRSGLSAGRVQSVTTRLIVEREKEIEAFVPREYWTIEAELRAARKKINAKFHGDINGKIELENEAQAMQVVDACTDKEFTVTDVNTSVKSKSPAAPFSTSTLLQEASKRLGFQSKKIMRIAQELYEGINLGSNGYHGIITYMRTDSLRISDEAAREAEKYITSKFGKEYYPAKRRIFKSDESAQDAHEAIRPANVTLAPDDIKPHLTSEQYKLYKLIWDRFMASQMKNAEIETISADIRCGDYVFKSSENTVLFKGYLLVYDDADDAGAMSKLSSIKSGDVLNAEAITPKQNFTDAPPRYTEGSLIKVLKEKGIGRPSTYATTITTIISRNYVELDKKLFRATPLGVATVELMKKNFSQIVDYKFTANMETSLDKIADGDDTYEQVLTDFYGDFDTTLEEAQKHLKENKVKIPDEESDIICDKCGRKMVIKTGRYGKFAACPGYPECKNTKPLTGGKTTTDKPKAEPEKTDMVCEKCGAPLVIRDSRYGKFYACTAFPKCRYTKAIREDIGVPCPKCGAKLILGHGKRNTVFYGCSNYPECDFSSWNRPLDKTCPKCGSMLELNERKNEVVCSNKECDYKEENE